MMDRVSNSQLSKGAAGGAISAGIFVVIVMSLVFIVFATGDALTSSWLPYLLFIAVVTALLSAPLGALSGYFGTMTQKPILGALVGSLIFALGAFVYVSVFLSSRGPSSEAWTVVFYSVIAGYISGSIGTIVGSRISDKNVKANFPVFQQRTLLFTPAILMVSVWSFAKRIEQQDEVELEAKGCYVTWNALEYPEGRWQIHFQDSKIDDEGIHQLVGILAKYNRLDLILNNSQVTDQCVEVLGTLRNLARLRLENTTISNDAIAELRSKLPHVTISM